jgi:hypothetical protein
MLQAPSAVKNPDGGGARKKIPYSSVAGVFARLLYLHNTSNGGIPSCITD